jgi:protein involved in polysaccharide export with SLBB domain
MVKTAPVTFGQIRGEKMENSVRRIATGIMLAGLSACAQVRDPANIDPVDTGGGYQAQYRDLDTSISSRSEQTALIAPDLNAERCAPPRGGTTVRHTANAAAALTAERLSRGDLLDIRVAEDDTFSGSYEISRDGMIRLPFLDPIPAQGRMVTTIERDINEALIDGEFYVQETRVSVRLMDFGAISISVSGAVFEPRPVEIGGVSGDTVDSLRQSALGASTEGRDLAAALRAAGGIRPDADLSAVEIHRLGQTIVLDLRAVMEGRDRADVPLLTGDTVVVPSRGCFQDALMRPSPISPPGVTLFLSNLTQPAAGNAISAIGRDVREIPYGTRFLQAVVDTNCVGGARATSAWRAAALISRNPLTGHSVVIERDIETMLRRADRDDYDPYMLPGDAIACYDSTITSLSDLGGAVAAIATGLAP